MTLLQHFYIFAHLRRTNMLLSHCGILLLMLWMPTLAQQPCNLYCGQNEGPFSSTSHATTRGSPGAPGKRGPKGDIGLKGENGTAGQKGEVGVSPDLEFLEQSVVELKEKLRKSIPDPRYLPRSCKEILDLGNSRGTGVYYVRDGNNVQYPVYCDMELDGGGWTLVASIHENNLSNSGRCTSGDRWSSEQGHTSTRPEGDGNWSNRNIFGHVSAATSDDYKNPGYFELVARNMMIWHVPNSTPLSGYNTSAYLQYRTNNHFFDRYSGGNLYHLYKDHFPIKSGVYTRTNNGPSEPLVFDRGNKAEVLSHQAPNAKAHLEAGYIQFRVMNGEGNAFALSPGVRHKASSHNVEHTCIGSTASTRHINYCGDFAAFDWFDTSSQRSWSVDQTLANTAFLIFYR